MTVVNMKPSELLAEFLKLVPLWSDDHLPRVCPICGECKQWAFGIVFHHFANEGWIAVHARMGDYEQVDRHGHTRRTAQGSIRVYERGTSRTIAAPL